MRPSVVEVVEFGGLRFEMHRRQLWRRATRIDLPKRLAEVLGHLIENRHRTVSKEELLQTLWVGEAVSASVVPNSIAALRKALGQSDAHSPLQTVRGRGYRFSAPVKEWSPARSRETRTQTQENGFVGRHQTLAELGYLVQGLSTGRGGVALVAGPPGIGKTRLLDELLGQSLPEGLVVGGVRCSEVRDGEPLLPLRRALAAARLALPEITAARDVWREADAAQRFSHSERVAQALLDRVQENGLILRLEDLQWADEATLQALQLLSLRARERPLLVLATVRTEHQDGSALSSSLHRLLRTERVVRHYLRPLPRAQVAKLLELLGAGEGPTADRSEVQEIAAGNPLIVSEFCATDRSDSQRLVLNSEPRLPEASLLPAQEKVRQLEPEVRRVLQTAATLGQEFALARLLGLSDGPRAEILAACDKARAAGVLLLKDGGRAEFVGRPLYEACYRDVSAGQRAVLHSRAAVLLGEAMIPGDLTSALDVALHELRALPFGDVTRAVQRVLNAAQEARARGAYDFARRLLELALEASASGMERSGEVRAQLHVELVLIAYATGDVVGARRSAENLYEESISGGAPFFEALGAALWAALSDPNEDCDAPRRALNSARLTLSPRQPASWSMMLMVCAKRLSPELKGPSRRMLAAAVEAAEGPEAELVQALLLDGQYALEEAERIRRSVRHPEALLEPDGGVKGLMQTSASVHGPLRPTTVIALGRSRRRGRLRALGHLRLGDRAEAERALEGSAGGPPGLLRDPWGRAVLRAELAYQEGRWEEARGHLSQLITWPEDPWATRARAQLLRCMEGPGAAGRHAEGLEGGRYRSLRRRLERGEEGFVRDAVRGVIASSGESQGAMLGPELAELAFHIADFGSAELCDLMLEFFEPLSGTFIVTPTLHVRCAVDHVRGALLRARDARAAQAAFEAAADQCAHMRASVLRLAVERDRALVIGSQGATREVSLADVPAGDANGSGGHNPVLSTRHDRS